MLHGVTHVSVGIEDTALRASDAFTGGDIIKWLIWRA